MAKCEGCGAHTRRPMLRETRKRNEPVMWDWLCGECGEWHPAPDCFLPLLDAQSVAGNA